MTQVSIHEAKTHLSRLLRRVACGEEIIIAKANQPVALLVPFKSTRQRKLGVDQGAFEVPDNFDDPLPDEIIKDFEQ